MTILNRMALLTLVTLVLVFATVSAQSGAQRFTGNEFRQLDSGRRGLFVSGFVQGMILGAGLPKQNLTRLVKCTENMTYEQMQAIVDKFLLDHPDVWHWHVANVILGAFAMVCLN